MDQKRLEAIRLREAKATEGPWVFRIGPISREVQIFSPSSMNVIAEYYRVRQEDVEFMRHARKDIPDLLDYIAELEQRLAQAQD